MDISAFSDDNFDTKTWVNNILKHENNLEKTENYTMSLVMKLQLYVQQVNNSLEETSQKVLMALPKILRDTKNLYEESTILKQKMAIVHDEITKIESSTRESIETIEKLDSIENQLILAKQSLQETDNWTILINDLEDIFDTRDVEIISAKILSMQKCIKLLRNIDDYEERKLQLDGLKNRLEAICSPAIVQAFTCGNLEQSLFYVRVFKSIERLPQLIKYYHKCQKDVLLKKWRNQLEIEQDENILQIIHNFYDILLSNWHTQLKWFNQIFTNENCYRTLIEIYIDVLNNLDPNLNECIDAALKQIDDKLNFVNELKQITKQFADNLVNLIDTNQIDKETILLLLQSIYNYLKLYMNKYTTYEQTDLIKKLSNIKCIKDELSDTIQALNLSIPQIFDLAKDAQKHCEIITENYCCCGLINALRQFFLNYANQYRVALRQIERNRKHERTDDDLNNFQLCLLLLQNCGEILLQLDRLEKDLINKILQNEQKKQRFDYKLLLLNTNDRREYESLIKCINDGTQLSILDHVINEFNQLCTDIHHTTYQIVFAPISIQLDLVQSTKIWQQFNNSNSSLHNNDLPDYSFSPQEYITQIGQYLMTLPQHLEPFLFQENPALTCAFKAADQEYNTLLTNDENSKNEGDLAHIFLKIIARGTCQGYCDRILSIRELNYTASRQLAHDIGYLNNVLQDLGISLSENLQQLALLLKLPNDQYQTQSAGCSARYVATIRQIRNIKSN